MEKHFEKLAGDKCLLADNRERMGWIGW